MKKYDTKFIKEYIEKNKGEIVSVACGMREDWKWTHDIVYENGEFLKKFKWNSKSIKVEGITGSGWATPVMYVLLKNGETRIVECWYKEKDNYSYAEIERMKLYASRSGGMDYLLL